MTESESQHNGLLLWSPQQVSEEVALIQYQNSLEASENINTSTSRNFTNMGDDTAGKLIFLFSEEENAG